MATKKNEVAKTEAKDVEEFDPNDFFNDLDLDDAGSGLENMGADERRIPMLRVLQANSPQVIKQNEKFVPGATPGGVLNIATFQVYDGENGIPFIPVARAKNYVEYIPRGEDGSGGGFVSIWDRDDPRVDQLKNAPAPDGSTGDKPQGGFARLITADGTEVVETFYLFGMIIDEHGMSQEIVVPFASTQIKKYQSMMERLNSIKYTNPKTKEVIVPALFAHRWVLKTVYEHNKKGEFYGWQITLAEDSPYQSILKKNDPLYLMAKEFNKLVEEGQKVADVETDAASGANVDPDYSGGSDGKDVDGVDIDI